MARPLRVEFPGAVYHVTTRGNRRQHIFQDDADRSAFLKVLESVVRRFHWVCHSYCLMGNHYHLMVETPEPNLSAGMRQLNGVYTQRSNRRHRTSGHMFQGRFGAVVIEKESHLLEVCRYVVLNPVRGGMVDHPRQWRWSAYRASAGLRSAPPLLTTDWILAQFGRRRQEAQRAYREFVREGLDAESPFDGLVGRILLGSETFIARCRAQFSDAEALLEVSTQERYAGRPMLEVLFRGMDASDKSMRNAVIADAHLQHGYTLKSIGDFLGLHYTTISAVVRNEEGRTL